MFGEPQKNLTRERLARSESMAWGIRMEAEKEFCPGSLVKEDVLLFLPTVSSVPSSTTLTSAAAGC